jgi:hypothetical protein
MPQGGKLMDIMELGAIGELVGGAAVLVTLVYLVIQIRQNTSQVRLSTATAMIANIQAALEPVYEHFDTFDRGLDDDADLPGRDARMFSLLMLRIFHALQNSYYQQIEGALGSDWYLVHLNAISAFTHRLGGLRWWNENREKFAEDFREKVDSIAGAPTP